MENNEKPNDEKPKGDVIRMSKQAKDSSALYMKNPKDFKRNLRLLASKAEAVERDDELAESDLQTPTKYNEINLSKMFAEQHVDVLRYSNTDKINQWFTYIDAEGRWAKDEKMRVYTLCKAMLTRVAIEASEAAYQSVKIGGGNEGQARKASSAVANALTSAAKVHSVIDLARSDSRLIIALDMFDTDNWVLNTPGGVVDLRTGKMRPAEPTDYFTKVTKVAPRDMLTPIWDKFAREVMGSLVPVDICACAACIKSADRKPELRQKLHNAEVTKLVDYVDEIYAYCLTGDVKQHMLILEIGEGGNGKGLLNDLLGQDILGRGPVGYACEVPVEALLASRNDRHPTDLMGLFRSRLALARESEDRNWNEGMVKRLSGGDEVTARKMRMDFITFDATHKLVVFGQHKPALRGSDQQAWKRRLHLIPFPQKWDVPADPARNILLADTELRTKLVTEAPGILHKLIAAGVKRFKLEGGIKKPATVRAAAANYLADEDDLGAWVRIHLVVKPDGFLATNTAFDHWRTWCEERKIRAGRSGEFPDEVVKRFHNSSVRRDRLSRQAGGNGIRGIDWRPFELGPQKDARKGNDSQGDEREERATTASPKPGGTR